MPTAHVPGFRPGHAPRKLVEHRFRKDVGEQGQGRAVDGQPRRRSTTSTSFRRSASRTSIWRRSRFPKKGPMTFEFDLEVRPEFDLPQVEGPGDREAGARVHRRRRRSGVEAAFWPTAAGWCRSTGRPSRATTSPRTSPSSTATRCSPAPRRKSFASVRCSVSATARSRTSTR